MRKRWLMTACATVLIAFTGIAAVAQERNDENHGQSKKEYRQFNDKQKEAARSYYKEHQDHPAFRQPERWNDDYESRIRPGYVLDADMRRMSRPAPPEMLVGLGRAPRGYRYVVIGGHVVLVDGGYRIHDAIHLELNIGH